MSWKLRLRKARSLELFDFTEISSGKVRYSPSPSKDEVACTHLSSLPKLARMSPGRRIEPACNPKLQVVD